MKLNDAQRIELAAAAERGFLTRRRKDRPMRLAYSAWCDEAQRPLIELVSDDGYRGKITYDLVFTGASLSEEVIGAFKDLIRNIVKNSTDTYKPSHIIFELDCVVGQTGVLWMPDAVAVAEAAVTICECRV